MANRNHSLNFMAGDGSMQTPFIIGVAGGTSSGKSTVCRKIMEKLGQDSIDYHHKRVFCITQDCFYKELNQEEKAQAVKGNYNFDHPDALDEELMYSTLCNILNGREVKLPVYDFKENSRKVGEELTVCRADVVLFEGILVFYFPQIRDLFHMKLFVDTDPDTRLSRRVLRDVQERGRDLEVVLSQYTKYVKPAFEEFSQPTKKFSDVIIPRGSENEVAIDLIVQTIKDYLAQNPSQRPPTPGLSSGPARARNFSESIALSSATANAIYGTSPTAPQSPTGLRKPLH